MKENLIAEKSRKFAVRIVRLRRYLSDMYKEWVLSDQVCRSGTSIGANIREAYRAQSDADFLSKLYIALKEADETMYWLHILRETDYISEKMYSSLSADCNELIRILVSIIKTKKSHMH